MIVASFPRGTERSDSSRRPDNSPATYMRLFTRDLMRFDVVPRARATGGGAVTPAVERRLGTSAHCGGSLSVASGQSHRRFTLFRGKSLTFRRSMTRSESDYRENRTSQTSARLRLMKSEAIGEEDTAADPAVCEHRC